MVSLRRFRQNSHAIKEGEWKSPGEEFGDLEILTRGYIDQYFDAKAALERAAARRLGVEIVALPAAEARAISVECIRRHLVLDVRNLEHDEGEKAGQPVSIDEFREMLSEPDLWDLTMACLRAAAKVGQSRKADVADAVGNSSRPSAPTSGADAS